MQGATYKDAGVDLEVYAESMRRLPALMQRTHAAQRGRVMDLPGGFAGLFRLFGDGGRRYRDPVLVSGTDGVGTKIKVAILAGVHNTVGIDLVGMCVNDCLCLGAEPLFFLDYLAMGKDDPDLVAGLVEGVSAGCQQARLALLGGETAIMPDLYSAGEFDLAGFAVGVVEKEGIIDGKAIRPGDVVLGLESSGLHSNGYSLVRKIVFDRADLRIDEHVPELGRTVGEALLEPTRIYIEAISPLLEKNDPQRITGLAHITGGGLAENVERILPDNVRLTIDRKCWNVPPIFSWLQTLGQVDREEMFRVFNMGIGMVVIVRPEHADAVRGELGATVHVLGSVSAGERGVDLVN